MIVNSVDFYFSFSFVCVLVSWVTCMVDCLLDCLVVGVFCLFWLGRFWAGSVGFAYVVGLRGLLWVWCFVFGGF